MQRAVAMLQVPAPIYARPLGPIAAAGWSAVFLIVFAALVSIVAAIRPGSQYDQVNATLLSMASVLVVVLALARVHAPDAKLRDLVGARPIGFTPALLASLMGIAAMLPLRALDAFISRRFPLPEPRLAELVRGLSLLGTRERIVGTVATVLIAPIADELFFRGALATGVWHASGRRVALVITAFAFALINAAGDFHFIPYFCVVGFMMGHARFATGSVLAPIGAALSWRGADLAYVAWRYRSIDPLATEVSAPSSYSPQLVLGGALATVFFGALLMRFGSYDERIGGLAPVPAEESPRSPRGPRDDDESGGNGRSDDDDAGDG